MAHAVFFGLQVSLRVLVRLDLSRYAFDHFDTSVLQRSNFVGVVGDEPDGLDAQVASASQRAGCIGGNRRRSRAFRWPRSCRVPCPATHRPGSSPSVQYHVPPAARRSGCQRRLRRSVRATSSSCWRQSQRREPKTSPVRHWEWMRTRGGAELTSPITNATASSLRRSSLPSRARRSASAGATLSGSP